MESTTVTRRLTPVPCTQVRIADAFWEPRLRANREATLPAAYRQCKETGRIDAFKLDWQPGQEPAPHIFWDSDVAKWIEAASYSLATHPDPALEALLDEVVALVVSAQRPDGYLNVHFTVVEPEKRWDNLADCHELYCAGHLIEAAVAHFQATGKRELLDALCRYADYIDAVFGTEEGKIRGYCGHEEIELALVKLSQVTGNARYLTLAAYFVDERGQSPHYFMRERMRREGAPGPFDAYFARVRHRWDYSYCQAHKPVREQDEVTGHAVRAMYLYSAMADLAGELGDPSLLAACERLWHSVCRERMYITGGIGPSGHNEGFTTPYDLPNDTAYAETCAAIGLVFWNHRLLQLDCDGRYADIMERALYNGVISGVSLDGTRFFYVNPLASRGTHHRQAWFGCACCPPNLARLLASLPGYVYAESADGVAVHLYAAGEARVSLAGIATTLTQETRYPWEGQVRLTLAPAAPVEATLRLRIPGWCRQATVRVNGAEVHPPVEKGYACLARAWAPGDVVELDLAMPVEQVAAHSAVYADRGLVALQRGPLVYCLEDVDHAAPVLQIAFDPEAAWTARFDPDLLGGVTVLEGSGWTPDAPAALYRPADQATHTHLPLRAVPYYAWDNRAPGGMTVWAPVVAVKGGVAG